MTRQHSYINFWVLSLALSPILLASCSGPGPSPAPLDSLVNPAHLDHLYEKIIAGDDTLGAIWIYCEAPDYHLVADADEGFTCVDDVARALVFYSRRYQTDRSPEVVDKIRSLTEFLLYMRAKNGFFYNFLQPGPEQNTTHQNSQAVPGWWSWRAFWALSEVRLLKSGELSDLQNRIRPVMEFLTGRMQLLCPALADPVDFDGIDVPACLADLGADQVGVILMGLANDYQNDPSETAKSVLLNLGNLLLEVQHGDSTTWPYYAIMSWRNEWHAWGNSQAYALMRRPCPAARSFHPGGPPRSAVFLPLLPGSGIYAGFQSDKGSGQSRDGGSTDLSPDRLQHPPHGFCLPGGLLPHGRHELCRHRGRLATWFFGNNPAKLAMYDPATGRTFDGINAPTDVNRNSGAESTIEALLSLQAVEGVPEAKMVLTHLLNQD